VSRLVSALAKVYCGLPIEDAAERGVEQGLKKVIGRELFLAFLSGVEKCLTAEWKAQAPKKGDQPDTWIQEKRGMGLYAFYACNGDNAGRMLAEAMALKSKHGLKKIVICTADAESLPADNQKDLAKIGIVVIPLARLSAEIAPTKKTA
jgi:hypothetical protein